MKGRERESKIQLALLGQHGKLQVKGKDEGSSETLVQI